MSKKYYLTITFEMEDEQAAAAIQWAYDHLIELKSKLSDETKATLTREGDRSAANLLLDQIEGRLGWHHQTRKATIGELRPRLKYNPEDPE